MSRRSSIITPPTFNSGTLGGNVMYKRQTQVLQGLSITNSSFLLLPVLFFVLTSAAIANAQARFPGPAARENNRSMDEYDRTINRMKNDSKVNKERRLNLFP